MSPKYIHLGFVLLLIPEILEAKLRYAFIFPSVIQSEDTERGCLQLEDAQGQSHVQVTLRTSANKTLSVDRTFLQNSVFTCFPIKIPLVPELADHNLDQPYFQEVDLDLTIRSSGETIKQQRKVGITTGQLTPRSQILVQTDKPVYKPGQTVKFRIVSLKENLQPFDTLLPVVEIQDPGSNRIGQWRNVNLTLGMADLSYPLSPEPQLGEYTIRIMDKVHTFSVEEYVLPKFEATLKLPKFIQSTTKTFPVEICARYTYGKPVPGQYKGSLCRNSYIWTTSTGQGTTCVNLQGQLDKSGCAKLTMKSYNFYLQFPAYSLAMTIEGVVTVTEEGTGIELLTTGQTRITTINNALSFLNPKSNYKAGIPYSGTVEVLDSDNEPLAGQRVYLTRSTWNTTSTHNLLTDENGRAAFTLHNTEDWEDEVSLTASTMPGTSSHPFAFRSERPRDMEGHLTLLPLYSHSKSFLNLRTTGNAQSCDPQQEVQVEYIIRHTTLGQKTSYLSLHYLIISNFRIENSGSQEIPVLNPDKDLSGDLTLELPIKAVVSASLHALVYILLPNGEIIADSVKIRAKKCFKNQVSVDFSPGEVLPGSDVSLHVQAAPGSLCGLRVVDQSVVLMRPDKELTADKVFSLFPDHHLSILGDNSVEKEARECINFPGQVFNFPFPITVKSDELYRLFMDTNLNIITSAQLRKPLLCPDSPGSGNVPEVSAGAGLTLGVPGLGGGPGLQGLPGAGMGPAGIMPGVGFAGPSSFLPFPVAAPAVGGVLPGGGVSMLNTISETTSLRKPEVIRKYFPETWIWQLAPIGDSGLVDLHHSVPDTITDWNAGAMCIGPSGFGLSPSVALRVFQPFFVDLALPYSVVRGESFTLKASVFNYLQQCIKVQTDLLPSLEMAEEACPGCEYSSCLCAEESKTFYWNVTANKLGEVNITVRTEAVKTPEMCNNEIPVVPKQGNTDTMIKPLIVKPGGVLVEKSHNFMICIPLAQGRANPEEFSLNLPENILRDSERAYVTLYGDMMGTALQNVDRLLAMPFGCGEQNMLRLAPNIFILQYLEKTGQLTEEIRSKAYRFMEEGYQKQLKYKRGDGSYSAFERDEEGNTWLTAFVLKSFSQAKRYVFIDEPSLSSSFTWLIQNRYYTGCFRNTGRLLHSAMKGGVDDDVSLSAYVTIALLEANISREAPVVRDSVRCLQQLALSVTNMYTQALLAYVFTLYGDMYSRQAMLNRLNVRAVRRDGGLYWQPKFTSASSDPFWHRASSTEVELTSYVLLALVSAPTIDFTGASQIVKWLSKQQSAFGGFSSTQDTVVALQALAKYAEAVYSDKRDVTVTVTSKTGFLQTFHVDNDNRLLLQRATLPTIPGNYTVSARGSGCVYVQTVLRYNVPPATDLAAFTIRLEVKPTQCATYQPTKLQMTITVAYSGSRFKSNMAIIEVNMLSGFTPSMSSVELLKSSRQIRKAESNDDVMNLYLDELGRSPTTLVFMLVQDFPVRNLKPATVKVYDYYETDENAVAEYTSSCSWE